MPETLACTCSGLASCFLKSVERQGLPTAWTSGADTVAVAGTVQVTGGNCAGAHTPAPSSTMGQGVGLGLSPLGAVAGCWEPWGHSPCGWSAPNSPRMGREHPSHWPSSCGSDLQFSSPQTSPSCAGDLRGRCQKLPSLASWLLMC